MIFSKEGLSQKTTMLYLHLKSQQIKLDAEDLVCYREVLQKEMATITAFSKKEIMAIYAFIEKGGSPSNQGHHHHVIFEQYFKNREWFWPEFDGLKNVFVDFDFDCQFDPCRPIEEHEIMSALDRLKVAEIKERLLSIGVSFEPKTKKKDLVSLAFKQPLIFESISNSLVLIRRSIDYVVQRRKAIYSILMRTLLFRALKLRNQRRSIKAGITKAKWGYAGSSCGQGRGSYPGHKEADGEIYDISRGLEINGQYVQPGTLIFCTCVGYPIINFKD
ncbi:MAG: hypothetical protein M0R41_06320 [Methylobacter tundripaludum]|nr:hypothetical protein [Methylobacter tundripaludum]